MARPSARLLLIAIGAALLLPGVGRAQPPARVRVDVMVSEISNRPGPVDPRAARLHEKLHAEIRYESLRVLDSQKLSLALDEVGSLNLPNGRLLRLRPLNVSGGSVLMAVSVEGTLQSDMRIADGKLVAIRAGSFEDGSLVISLEPHL